MEERLSALWQLIRKHRSFVIYFVVMIVFVFVFFIVAQLIFEGYGPDWTGFNGYNKVTTAHTISGPNAGATIQTEEYQPGKTLYDWLQLLIIPAALAITALWFNRMSDLLLKEKLCSSLGDAEARKVARVRTITILFQLDARRIGYVFAFLRESKLMSTGPDGSIVSLNGADLRNINFSEADLSGAILREANLNKANLSKAILVEADVSEANLVATNLSEANLLGANLRNTSLVRADLSGANLIKANLFEASLFKATLRKARMGLGNISGVYLNDANLTGATGITTEELEKQARTLRDAIMPDGSKHK